MRKKSKHILSVFVLVLAFLAFAPSANAETTGCLTVSGTQAALKLTLLEGKTETITSLRLKLMVTTISGTMQTPAFQFNQNLPGTVKDAAVTEKEEGTYEVDLIVSRKKDQDIFQGTETAAIGTLVLHPKEDQAFQAEVRIAGESSNTADAEQNRQPVVYYVDSSGIRMQTLTLENAEAVQMAYARKTPEEGGQGESEPETPSTEEKPGETTPSTERKPENTTPQTGETPVTVAPVSGFTASFIGEQDVRLSWKKVNQADGYEVYRSKYQRQKDAYGKYKRYKRLKNGNQVRKLTVKQPKGTKYRYKVRAYRTDVSGKRIYGEFSGAQRARMAAPKLKLRLSAGGKLLFKWNKILRADGYKLYQYNEKTGSYRPVATIKAGTSCIRNVHTSKPQLFKLRAYETGKTGKKVYGYFSQIRKAEQKPGK